jgi:hypothetical protein
MLKLPRTRGSALLFAAVSPLIVASSSASGANILVDPSFELQTPPGSGGWSLFNGAAFSTDVAHTGTHSMKDFTANNVPGSFEQFPAAPGQQWEVTGFGLTPAVLVGNPGFGIVQFSFFDAANNNLGTVETGAGNAKTSAQVNSASPLNQWIALDTGIATAPANTAFVQAFTIVVDFNSPPAGEGVYFDDLTLQQVPEPASLGVLMVGAFGILGRPRRRVA